MPDEHGASQSNLSRRTLLFRAGITAAAATLAGHAPAADRAPAGDPAQMPADGSHIDGAVPVALRVNGQEHRLRVDARVTLLDALRERLGMTGSKKGCDHGQCGACTVLVDGRRTLSCLTLAVAAQGKAVTTIEGLEGGDGKLHPMQQAFIDCDAFQCGYCTPGQIMSAVATVKEGLSDTPENIREAMSGNLCRCAAYPNIVAAIQQAAPLMERS